MKKILAFPLDKSVLGTAQMLTIPVNSKFISADIQQGQLAVLYVVDATSLVTINAPFYLYLPGETIPDGLNYVATVNYDANGQYLNVFTAA